MNQAFGNDSDSSAQISLYLIKYCIYFANYSHKQEGCYT